MKLKILIIGFFALNALLLSLYGWMIIDQQQELLSTCSSIADQDDAPPLYPTKVVVQPWQGQHQVYGIFAIPLERVSSRRVMISIPGAGTYCGGITRVGSNVEGMQAPPKHYLVKANLRTRTAASLVTRGYLNQLQEPRNWELQ
jgi:hypothetical protein